MKILLISISLLFVASCATNPKIQAIYDSRNYSDSDKALVQGYVQEYIQQISAAGAIVLGASQTIKSVETVQKYLCVCVNKLGEKCRQKASPMDSQNHELWAKGNAAEIALIATGNSSQADPILCN